MTKKYSKIIEPFDNYHFWGKCQTCKVKRMLIGIRKEGDTYLGQCMKCGQMDVKSIRIKNKSKGGKKARKKKKKKKVEKSTKVFVTKHAYIRIMQRRNAFDSQIKYIEDVEELVKTAFKEGVVKYKGFGASRILEYGPFFFVIRPDKKREHNYVVVSFTHGFPPENIMRQRYYIKLKSSSGKPFEYDKVKVTFDTRCHRLDEKIKQSEKVGESDCGDAVGGVNCSPSCSPASKKEVSE